MKRLLFIILTVFAFVACEDEKGQLAGDAKIYINGRDRANKTIYNSAHELLCGDTLYMRIDAPNFGIGVKEFCFAKNNIDTIHDRLIMDAGNIETIDGNAFLTSHTLILCKSIAGGRISDTIGYIPHQQVADAYEQISELSKNEDWDKIYKIFSDAFTFIPCTAKECDEFIAAGY